MHMYVHMCVCVCIQPKTRASSNLVYGFGHFSIVDFSVGASNSVCRPKQNYHLAKNTFFRTHAYLHFGW